MILSGLAVAGKVLLNINFWFFYTYVMKADSGFNFWRESHKNGTRCIVCCSSTLSFKIMRFFYSYFFGFDNFKAEFENAKPFQLGVILFTLLNFLLSYSFILAVDISSLLKFDTFKWGTQLYICFIETLVLCIFGALMTIFEFFRLNKLIMIE